MNCYKCSSEEELSVKRTLKSGNILFICRPCRRADYAIYKERKHEPKKKVLPKTAKGWAQFAKEKNGSLMKKYADTSFLIAKGIL
jgi:hypothetical protein